MASNGTAELNGVIKFVGEEGKDISIYFNVNEPVKSICAHVLESLKTKHNFIVREDFEAILSVKINEILDKSKPKLGRQHSTYGGNSINKHIKTNGTEGSSSTIDIKQKSENSINSRIKKKRSTRNISIKSKRIRDSSYNLYKNNFKEHKNELCRLNRVKVFLVEAQILQQEAAHCSTTKSKFVSRKKLSNAAQEDVSVNKSNNFTLNNKQESSYSLGMKKASNFFMLPQTKRANNSKDSSSLLHITTDKDKSKSPKNTKALKGTHKKCNTIDYSFKNKFATLLKLPSFDSLCVNRKKMKKILSEKVYKYVKNCCIVRADQFGYYKNKINQRQGTNDQLNSSVFEMSSIFGVRGKRGTKTGYSFLAAKNNFKRQESLLSKEKENAIMETSIIQNNYKKNNSTQKNSSTKEMTFTFKKSNASALTNFTPTALNNSRIANFSKKKGYLNLEEEKEGALRKSSHKAINVLSNIVDELVPSKKTTADKFSRGSGYAVALEASNHRSSIISKSKKQLREVNKQTSSFNSKLKHEKNKNGIPIISQEHSLFLDDQGENISIIDAGISSKSLNQLLEKNIETQKDDKHNNAFKSKKSLNNTLTSLGLGSFNAGIQINIEKPQTSSNKSLVNPAFQKKRQQSNKQVESLILENDSNPTLQVVYIKPSFSAQDSKSIDTLLSSNLIAIKKLDLVNMKDDNVANIEDKISSPRCQDVKVPSLTPKIQKCLSIDHIRKSSSYKEKKSKKSLSYKKKKENSKNSPVKKVNEEHINKLYLSKRLIDLKKSKNFCSSEDTQACSYLYTYNNPSLAKSSIDNIDMYVKTSNGYKNKKMTFNSRTIAHHSKQIGTLASINSLSQNVVPLKEQSLAYKKKSQRILEVKKCSSNTEKKNCSKIQEERKQITNSIVNSYIERYYEKLLTDLYRKVVDSNNKLKNYDDLNIDEKLKKNFLEPIISIFYEKNLVFSLDLFVSIGKLIVKDLFDSNNL